MNKDDKDKDKGFFSGLVSSFKRGMSGEDHEGEKQDSEKHAEGPHEQGKKLSGKENYRSIRPGSSFYAGPTEPRTQIGEQVRDLSNLGTGESKASQLNSVFTPASSSSASTQQDSSTGGYMKMESMSSGDVSDPSKIVESSPTSPKKSAPYTPNSVPSRKDVASGPKESSTSFGNSKSDMSQRGSFEGSNEDIMTQRDNAKTPGKIKTGPKHLGSGSEHYSVGNGKKEYNDGSAKAIVNSGKNAEYVGKAYNTDYSIQSHPGLTSSSGSSLSNPSNINSASGSYDYSLSNSSANLRAKVYAKKPSKKSSKTVLDYDSKYLSSDSENRDPKFR